MRHRFTKVLLGAALFMLLGGTATVAARSHGSSQPRRRTTSASSIRAPGCSAPTAREYIQGFKHGLKYATNGTNKVNGKTINITYVDDKGDAATAVSAAKDLIGQGYKIIDRHRLLGRRAATRAARGPEPRPLHLGPGGGRRDHRRQQVHVPRRAARR